MRGSLRSKVLAIVDSAAGAEPGSRFINRFEARSEISRLHPKRLLRILLGLGLLSIGFANVFIPGPGGSPFILGSAIVLSGESRLLARFLDWGELKSQRQIRFVIERPIIAVTTVSVSVFATITAVGWIIAA